MKKLTALILGLLVSASAHAMVNQNSSWEEIMADRYVQVKAPTVYMGRAIDYTFVCRDGDNLRTQKPVDITETRFHGGREGGRTEIVVVGREYLSTPIDYAHKVESCRSNSNHDFDCKTHTVYGSYPMTVTIPVVKRISNRNAEREELLFRKSYTVPDCDGGVYPH
ncbi:hypothetical protein [Bdellovibrio reynosensis]|uniref:Uncharacterized protein n=1 Tax=Bdellovibrio reynosensis TaxID=2835041 RepID=A0ABY4C8Z5_9BACT|nr:hypothetical protein [Bdellovibrio reynosensis]UOF01410.1 hypothetical protein MNR06_00390 [Bdellovibrio reynosensis]